MAIDIPDLAADLQTRARTVQAGPAAARPNGRLAGGATGSAGAADVAAHRAKLDRVPSFESALARAGRHPGPELAETRRTVYDGAGKTPEERKASLRWAANQLESFLVNELFKAMRATVKDGGLIQKSQAEKMYQEMLDQEMSKAISESSPLGIADMIVQQLEDRI